MGWFGKGKKKDGGAADDVRHVVTPHQRQETEDRRTDRIIARLELVSEQVAESAATTLQSADRLDSALSRLELMLEESDA